MGGTGARLRQAAGAGTGRLSGGPARQAGRRPHPSVGWRSRRRAGRTRAGRAGYAGIRIHHPRSCRARPRSIHSAPPGRPSCGPPRPAHAPVSAALGYEFTGWRWAVCRARRPGMDDAGPPARFQRPVWMPPKMFENQLIMGGFRPGIMAPVRWAGGGTDIRSWQNVSGQSADGRPHHLKIGSGGFQAEAPQTGRIS